MDPKLTMLFALFGVIIVLSHLNEDRLQRMRQQFAGRRWSKLLPARLKS